MTREALCEEQLCSQGVSERAQRVLAIARVLQPEGSPKALEATGPASNPCLAVGEGVNQGTQIARRSPDRFGRSSPRSQLLEFGP